MQCNACLWYSVLELCRNHDTIYPTVDRSRAKDEVEEAAEEDEKDDGRMCEKFSG